MSTKTIMVGQNYHRSLTESTVVEFNPESKVMQFVLRKVDPAIIPRLRNRTRINRGPNIPVEAVVVHKTSDGSHASYHITTNRYGVNVVPWTTVSQEDLRKEAEITVFPSLDEKRQLSISQSNGKLVSVSHQDITDPSTFVVDYHMPKLDANNVSYALIDNNFVMFACDEDFDIAVIFRNLEDLDINEIAAEFSKNLTFSI